MNFFYELILNPKLELYIDQTLKNVSASCEFYYNGEESLKTCLDKAIEILGMVRPAFIKTMRSFD